MAKKTTALLTNLRQLMKSKQYVTEPLHAYIIPSADAHQSEYVASCDTRRAFISGFDGSAGTAIVTAKDAAMWTDSRYFLQASSQMDQNWELMKQGQPGTLSQEEWLVKVLPKEAVIGVDPHLLSLEQWKTIHKHLKTAGQSLVAVEQNLIDLTWADERPQPPDNIVCVHEMKYAGKSWQDKVVAVREQMQEKGADYLVVTALDEIAWLFNLRGSDVQFNPVFYSYAVISKDSVNLFIDEAKIDNAVRKHLNSNEASNGDDSALRVTIHPYGALGSFFGNIYVQTTEPKTWKRRIIQPSPLSLAKAIKNDVEIEGMRQSHIRDAVALCELFMWLENEVPKGKITEITAVDKAEQLRSQQADYVSLSFATISSIGSNGAIIHYKPTEESDTLINCNEVYLCDSGAQYKDGTTDTTRTMHFGTPSQHEKECYTRVLKGHIALSSAVFPVGTKGFQLDTLAREYLWQGGLDYGHGTGHGVGSHLNVHEGPCSIGYRPTANDVPLAAGMFLSDEPGYYEDGAFGLRVENVVLVKKAEFKQKEFLNFEPVTLVPIQQKMIDPSLLTEKEV
uniref:Xaa-Pro aminopeptidase 1-like n=1 Tax=Saccoglossus kowalevskii TaxID=10224 RepID=A0ABM0GSH7_SACKO|nr:PREDICTED: xaa-Pro aminopeptidase 1-like [Saccoglossus kowalevskii]